MSSVVISGDTSGQVTLAAPAVAGTTTLTLQAVTGTMALQNDVIGIGQTWQNFAVGTTRVSGTTYTNSTGKPITVIVNNTSGSGVIGLTVSPVVGGVTLPGSTANATYSSAYVSFIVPTGQTYSVTIAGAGTQQWAELR